MRRSKPAALGVLLGVTLALSACGSSGSASLGKFRDSKTELGALFDRLRDAGAVRIVQRQVDAEYKPDEREVFDLHVAPLTWWDRTYVVKNDELIHEGIRRRNDLLDISYTKINCPVVNYNGWFLYPDFAGGVPDDENLQVAFEPGILPHVLYELQYAVFSGRTEDAGGYVLTGKVLPNGTGLGWGYEPRDPNADVEVPIRLRLDSAGLPVELAVDYADSRRSSNSFTATFSYDDVEAVPTIENPRVYDLALEDTCDNYR